MHGFVFGKARAAAHARTLLVRAGTVWMWPGIALTERRGAACVPVAGDIARFWITRLHGPAANDSYALRSLAAAAEKLSQGDEAGAQEALDASGLTRLSTDGVALVRAVAGSLGIAPLDLPWAEGPRLWRAQDIEAHLPLFKEFAAGAQALAKAGDWDESKHPRWPAGSPDHQGGRFNHGESEDTTEGRSVSSNDGGNDEQPPEIPRERPPTREGRRAVVRGVADWLAEATLRGAIATINALLKILEATEWIRDEVANIRSYLDAPRSLEDLQKRAEEAEDEPKRGYEVHHIVEQTPARTDGFSEEQIEGRDNKVLVPTLRHRDINGWYSTPNSLFDDLSPRDYLRGKDWDTRRKVGIDALIKFGVLEP